jgi:hypothetical protein
MVAKWSAAADEARPMKMGTIPSPWRVNFLTRFLTRR